MHLQGGYGAQTTAQQQAAYGSTQSASGTVQPGYGASAAQQAYGQPTAAAAASDQQSKLAQIIAQVSTRDAAYTVHEPDSIWPQE